MTEESITLILSPIGHFVGVCLHFPWAQLSLKYYAGEEKKPDSPAYILLFYLKKKNNRTQAKSSLTSALALKHGSTSCESHFELWMLFFYFCFNVHGSLYTCNMYEHIFKDAVFD